MEMLDSELNLLSNRQLREKCLFYGLQNVPITKDTKQIIINKLMECMYKEKEKKKTIKTRQAEIASQSQRCKSLSNTPEKFTLTNKQMNLAKILDANVLQRLRIESDKQQNKKIWTSEPRRAPSDYIEEVPHKSTSKSSKTSRSSEPRRAPFDYIEEVPHKSNSKSNRTSSRSKSTESVYVPLKKRIKSNSALLLFGRDVSDTKVKKGSSKLNNS